MSGSDDFSKYPESIAERRADDKQNAGLWLPRDALISLLREIDSGKIVVDTMFIALGEHKHNDDGTIDTKTHFRAAGAHTYDVLGVATRAIHMLQEAD